MESKNSFYWGTVGLVWGLILIGCCGKPGVSAGATLDTHTVVLDGTGNLLSWVAPQDRAYGQVATLSANFIKAAMTGPIDPNNGWPVIYTHSEYDATSFAGSGWPNNPAGKHAMLADSMMLFYAYSGDTNVLVAVQALLDFQLSPNGTTPKSYYWSNVPWSTAAAGNLSYGTDNMSEGVGMLEPDKIGELGFHGYLRFYEITGNTNYRNAAIACADALAAHVRPGSAIQSPWPFRANAQTGALGATPEDYCADVVAPIRLFDELIRLGLGNTNAYATARATAWNWLMTYPIVNNDWAQYFEDDYAIVDPHYNLNQYNAGQTARYLLEHPELDPNWQAKASNIIAWIETTFGGTDQGEPGLQYGARTISEQIIYKYKMASHTGRFAAINALYAQRTGDVVAKEKAFRSLNWSSYMARTNGAVIEGPFELLINSPCWFTDGHGDYIRHFMLAMGAFPEWAPADENHLLHSTSVIRSVSYGSNTISYATFDEVSTETLRIAFTPAAVLLNSVLLPQLSDLTQPGWVFEAGTGVLRIRHDTGANVQILAQLPGDQPPSITTVSLPNGIVNAAYTASLTASGGIPPYSWSVATGSLPTGLTLDAVSGLISGTPTDGGIFAFTVQVSDANNPAQTASQAYSVGIGNPVGNFGNTNDGTSTDYLWSNGDWINACRFQATSNMMISTMRAKVAAIPGRYKCAIYTDSSSRPNQLLRSTAEVTNPGNGWQTFPLTSSLALTNGQYYWLAIWSDDVNGQVYYSGSDGDVRWGRYDFAQWPDPINTTGGGNHNYCIYAASVSSPLVITTFTLPSAELGIAYAAQMTATGGIEPYLWAMATNASAPLGLTLSISGVLSGVPISAGQFNLPVVITDFANLTANQSVNLVISDLMINLSVLPQSGDKIASLGFKLTISANQPGNYLVQRTPNFIVWEDVQQVIYTNGGMEVTDNSAGTNQTLFYRAVRQ